MSNKSTRKSRLLLVILLAISTFTAAIVGGYVMGTAVSPSAIIPVKIEDPITISDYPTSLQLYPGQTKNFTFTVQNAADITYTLSFDFQLNDSGYQSQYVSFKNSVFTIAPGDQILINSLTVSANAPPANLILTVSRTLPQPSATTTPMQTPQTTQPTQSSSPTSNSTTQTPSVTLFGAGAKWASPNGTKALYLSWLDNYDAHGLTDGQNWGPWFDVPTMTTWKDEIVQSLQQDGFVVTTVGDLPQSLSGYDLVVLEAFWAIEPRHQALVKNFISNGGGVAMLGMTPCFFSVYCKDRWPYRAGEWPTGPGGTDLTQLSDWFGYKNYVNVGGSAYPKSNNPFGTSLMTSDQLFYTPGGSAASVSNPVGDTNVIAQYSSGTSSSTMPFPFDIPNAGPTAFAFTHTYGAGRVYWQGHIWPY